VSLVGRSVVGAALLLYLGVRIDWAALGAALADLRVPWALLGLLVLLAIRLAAARRWHMLIRAQFPGHRALDTLRMIFVSDFLAHFLPYGVGGDMARVVQLSRAVPRTSQALPSVLMDRILGTWVMLAFGIIGLVVTPVPLRGRGALLVLFAASLAASIGLFAAVLRWRERAVRALGRVPLLGSRARRLAADVVHSLDGYGSDGRLLVGAVALTVLINVLRILFNWCFAMALGCTVSIWVHVIAVPVIFSMSQIPVSIDAIGVREAFYVYVYSLGGVSPSIALGMALVARSAGYLLAVPGALLYARHGLGSVRRGSAEPTAEEEQRR